MQFINFRSVITLTLMCTAGVFAQAGGDVDTRYDVVEIIASIDSKTKTSVCRAQIETCSILCDGTDNGNSCDPIDLSFGCYCNSAKPEIQKYKNTVVSFICNAVFDECNRKATSEDGKAKCQTSRGKSCGTLDPADYVKKAQTTTTLGQTVTLKASSTELSQSESSSSVRTTSTASGSFCNNASITSTDTLSASTTSSLAPTTTASTTIAPTTTAAENANNIKPTQTVSNSSAKVAIGVAGPLVLVVAFLALL